MLLNRGLSAGVRSLQHRDFRLLWGGLIVSAIGTWMQIVAQSLLVLRLSHNSGFALGLVSLAQALSFFLFALLGGGFADRIDRRRLVLGTQTLLMCLALAMGILTIAGIIQVWMIVVIAFLSGATLSFDQPARAALISSLVPKEDLLNAISLQSAVFNGAATIGPALAGITIDAIGLPANFFLNAVSFLAVLFSLFPIHPPRSVPATGWRRLLAQIREALSSVKRDAVLPGLLLSYGILLFSGPSLPLLLPVLAVRNLHITASTLGLLFSAAGIGAVLGALLLASISDGVNKSDLLFGAFALWVSSLAVVGFSRNLAITFVALVFFGLSQSVIGAITSTVLQTRVAHEMRGRVMSLNTLLVMGVRPLGDFPAGALISLLGAPLTAAAASAVVGLAVFSLFVRRPALRNF
ncbi:MAG: MFS transporter [Acidobacteriaceae bacterium]|nr:MFS transporter [Acidobacteriaceae bacterium]MBV9781285.1 MFS transporter [Acidobacteriaceae bacterium]